jgi:hypothetical protein
MEAAIGHLRSMLSSFDVELDCEEFFTPREVASHAATARRIQAVLTARLHSDLTVLCLRQVPEAMPIHDGLSQVYEDIGGSIVGPLDGAMALPEGDVDRTVKIKHLIKIVIRRALRELRRADRLPQLHASARLLTARLEQEWDDAVLGLRGVRTCCPTREGIAPAVPQDAADFLKHAAQIA